MNYYSVLISFDTCSGGRSIQIHYLNKQTCSVIRKISIKVLIVHSGSFQRMLLE